MRTTSLLIAGLLLCGGLALVPAASADPACTTDLCGPDPNQPPTCNEKTYGSASDSVTVHSDCTVLLETGKGINCVGAWTGTSDSDIGPVHWTRHYCTLPGGDPLCCVSSASSASLPDAIPPCQCAPAPLCEPIVEMLAPGEGPVTYTLSEYCAATVTIDVTQVVDCVYGTHKTITRGPVTVIYPVCSSPCGPGADYCPPPADVGATAPNYCSVKEDTPTSVGPVPLNLRTALWGSDCYVDVNPVTACAPPSGFVVERIIGPVHLHLLVCDGGIGQRVGDILEAIGPLEA